MTPQLILIALIAAPVVVLFLLRVNAAFVFLSLCLGNVLAAYATKDLIAIVSGASTTMHASDVTVKLGLLLVPAVLTTLFMIKTVKGNKRILNVLPAVGTGLLLTLLVVPQLPPGLMHSATQAPLWGTIQELQSGLVAISTIICLLFLWMQRPKTHHEDDGGAKKHKGRVNA